MPAGRYYLRVEPEMEKDGRTHAMSYEIVIEARKSCVLLVLSRFFGLLIPPIVVSIRSFSFENRRWAESDYGASVQIRFRRDDD